MCEPAISLVIKRASNQPSYCLLLHQRHSKNNTILFFSIQFYFLKTTVFKVSFIRRAVTLTFVVWNTTEMVFMSVLKATEAIFSTGSWCASNLVNFQVLKCSSDELTNTKCSWMNTNQNQLTNRVTVNLVYKGQPATGIHKYG